MKDNILQKSIYAIFFLSFSLLIFSALDRYQTTKNEVILVHKKNQNLLTDNLVLEQKELLEKNVFSIKRSFNIDGIKITPQNPQDGLFSISKQIYGKYFIKYSFLKKYLKTIAPLSIFSVLVILLFFFSTKAQKEVSRKLTIAKVAEAKSELADLVYHDIKSPLTQLKNFIQENNDSKNLAKESFQQIEQVLENLNSYNKEENSFKEIMNLKSFLDETISLKKKEYSKLKNLQIDLVFKNIPKEFSVSVNKSGFQRSLSNIINNSIEASTKSKNIQIELLVSIEKEKLKVLIIDNGTGLYIRSPFSRNTSSKSQSGLGLYQSKQFIESIKGSITIQNSKSPDKGVSVEIKIPLKEMVFSPSGIILIDDSEIVHKNWEIISKSQKLPHSGFKCLKSFLSSISELNRNHTVFIDYNLKKSITNIRDIQKIRAHGFCKIVINSSSKKALSLVNNETPLLKSKTLKIL